MSDEKRPMPPRPARVVERPAAVPHRDHGVEAIRHQSDADFQRAAEMAAIVEHNRHIEGSVAELRAALLVIARELGATRKLPDSLRASERPPAPGEREQTHARVNTRSYWAALGAALFGLVDVVFRIQQFLETHFPHFPK